MRQWPAQGLTTPHRAAPTQLHGAGEDGSGSESARRLLPHNPRLAGALAHQLSPTPSSGPERDSAHLRAACRVLR